MNTVFDWITLGIFAGLVVLFLQRSIDRTGSYQDHIWQYLLAGISCAAANYLGNEGYVVAAIALIVATVAFILYVLKPFPKFPPL